MKERSPIPMTKKRRYKSISVNDKRVAAMLEALPEGRLIVGIDIAKTRQFAALMSADSTVHGIIRWDHPMESPRFMELLEQMDARCEVETAMEPSSTYGDAIRSAILDAGMPVNRVNPKRTHDAAEVYDGVPSLHDAKSATLVAKLHLEGGSEPWPVATDQERGLRAALRVLTIYQKQFQKNRNRLEGLLARHWPELPRVLDLGSVTLLSVLIEFGSAAQVAARPEEARTFMRRKGGTMLSDGKISNVVEQAFTSFGVPPIAAEVEALQEVAGEARRCQQAMNRAKKKVESLTDEEGPAREMRAVLGRTTAAVLIAAAGDPKDYRCSAAYQKALGLNLKEKSSGNHQGGLHISKRGSGIARHFLYLAALRLLQRDAIVRAWYDKKVTRQGGHLKSKAIIAIMRKLSRALWHVAKGAKFDAEKLFDKSRLNLASQTMEATG